MTKLIREDIKTISENDYFNFYLKSKFFKIIHNHEYSLALEDLRYNVEEIYSSQECIQKKKLEKLKKQELFLKDFVKKDSKSILEKEDIINIRYFSIPIFIDEKSPMKMLRFELLSIVELNDKYDHSKYSYIFANNKECLEFISTTTIRFGETVEDDEFED